MQHTIGNFFPVSRHGPRIKKRALADSFDNDATAASLHVSDLPCAALDDIVVEAILDNDATASSSHVSDLPCAALEDNFVEAISSLPMTKHIHLLRELSALMTSVQVQLFACHLIVAHYSS
jgi:hypothetical protein